MSRSVQSPVLRKLFVRTVSRSRRQPDRLNPQRTTRPSSTYAKSTITPGYFPPPEALGQRPAYVHLSNRSLIRLQGPDVVSFLNGLLPAKLQSTSANNSSSISSPIFTAFLSAKGRILYEAFIYPPTDPNAEAAWYIDTESTALPTLFSHLKKHKLRSKLKLEKISADDLGIYYVWPGHNGAKFVSSQIGGQDPRPLMGTRFLAGPSESTAVLDTLKDDGIQLSLQDYHIHRILSGHAEGPTELVPSSALPQESNIDFDRGIDFHKGCYLGQELTIRTHHTGVVRKRILPCQILSADQQLSQDQTLPMYDASVAVHQPPSEANISRLHARGRSGRSTGKWLGGVGNIGLALCRLEMMTDIQLTAEGPTFDSEAEFNVVWEDAEADADGKTTMREAKVKPFVPQWLRDNIQSGIQARSDRSKRRRQEDDDSDEDVD